MKHSRSLLAASVMGVLATTLAVPASAASDTVTISGNAYAFIFAGNTDRLPGAVIGVDQIPGLTVVAGANGAYEIEVPDDRDITLHATAPGYHEVYTQTFHTSGADLKQVNFQMPTTQVFGAMAQFAGAPLDGNGNPVECAVVSTAFELKGRSFADFNSFHDFRPHGVAGVVASKAGPASPRYFNASVIPDASLTESSRDGGIAWTGVPAGRHTLSASSPTHRFASFVADCRPGRFINASPPWGLHELANNETTNEAALAAPSVSLSVPASTRFGAAATATIAVTGPDGSRDGVVTVKDGATTVGSADVVAGAATIPLAGLSVGEHQLTARYVPRGRSHWSTTAPSRISVQRGTTSTTLAAPSRADRKRMVSLRVRVRATGTEPRGTVKIYDGTKRLRTVSVKAGTFVVKVRLKKTGKRSLRAVFSGSQVAEGSQSAVQRIRVR